jgi:surfeit locus 1 family protein
MNIIQAITEYRLVSLRILSYHFNPGVFSTLITVALLYTMMSLAFWQISRAEFKDTLQQKIIERKNLSPVTLAELPASSESRRYHPVKFIGEFDNQHSFLLDNITFNGHVGYHVFTPVKVNDAKTILVNRGFVSQGKTRDQLPEVDAPGGKIEISGLLDFSPSRTLLLAENVQEMSRWPVVLQYIDLTEISQLLGYQLYDMVLWLNPDEAGSFEYDLPVLNLNAAKNNGYAFQWFAMSLALFIIYIVVNTKRIIK